MAPPSIKMFVLPGGKRPERKSKGAAAYDVFARAIVSPYVEDQEPKNQNLRRTILDFFNMPEDWKMAKKCHHNPVGRYNLVYRMEPDELVFIGLGFVTEMPDWMCYRTENRSGLASKKILIYSSKITDSDYRGEAIEPLYNGSGAPFDLTYGMRIGQIKFESVVHPNIITVDSYGGLSATDRGGGGFGSTGIK